MRSTLGKKQKDRTIQTMLSLNYSVHSATTLAYLRVPGCVNVYSPENLLLFVSACCYHKTAKIVSIDELLRRNNKDLDYWYFIINLCQLISNYQWKQRAIGTFRSFLKKWKLSVIPMYTVKVHADVDKATVKKWCHRCLKTAGKYRPR